eukprot:CAMPEP_0174310544 /NCGR_PEP_ID=MMETSP0810-20121108/3111_1 /TAXON_ID=73025 ORGANISM="Eutreptiella gymnastica-like, Strain CCMP1594" /NCGR_SAMPLE_ID=MMETSP0810 /ASSEMBLY_ACC=CAM_ASM_000659 /LENGTH=207 /DNA_ID=CAMNT_0015418473 /DNA_START=44 /DNA_END=666 /DNA_ORIENTATION=+
MQTANDQGFGGTFEVVIDIEARTALNSREGRENPRVAMRPNASGPVEVDPETSEGYEAWTTGTPNCTGHLATAHMGLARLHLSRKAMHRVRFHTRNKEASTQTGDADMQYTAVAHSFFAFSEHYHPRAHPQQWHHGQGDNTGVDRPHCSDASSMTWLHSARTRTVRGCTPLVRTWLVGGMHMFCPNSEETGSSACEVLAYTSCSRAL